MYLKYFASVAGLTALMVSGQARADADLYLAASAGAAVLEETDIADDSRAIAVETTPVPGFLLSGAAGLDFGFVRIEGEGLFERHALDDFRTLGLEVAADGEISTIAGMANVYVELPTPLGITPYIGGGVGYAEVSAHDIGVVGVDLVDDEDAVFAYQAKAGIAFTALPFVDLVLGYRFFATEDLNMTGESGGAVDLDGLRTHVGEITLRFSF